MSTARFRTTGTSPAPATSMATGRSTSCGARQRPAHRLARHVQRQLRQQHANLSSIADHSWQIVGTGDFNGDGISDILWRNTNSGSLTDWLGTSNGSFVSNNANVSSNVNHRLAHRRHRRLQWRRDQRHPVAQRQQRPLTDWLGTSNGSFVSNSANLSITVEHRLARSSAPATSMATASPIFCGVTTSAAR